MEKKRATRGQPVERELPQKVGSTAKIGDEILMIISTTIPWASTTIKIMVDPIWMIKTLR